MIQYILVYSILRTLYKKWTTLLSTQKLCTLTILDIPQYIGFYPFN